MKDIQELIMEIDNLSDQIAVTLNEEEKTSVKLEEKELIKREVPLVKEEKEYCKLEENTLESRQIEGCIPGCPSNRRVDFCCILNVPGNLGIVPQDFLRVLFSTDCLRCVVEPCSANVTVCGCPIPVTLYNVRIVGCIPFLINHAVNSTECFSNPNFLMDLCCSDSVCVNNVICTRCNQADANAACERIRQKLTNCNCTTVTFNPVTNLNCNGVLKGLQVSGFFTLPNCNAQVGGNCNPQ